MHQQAPKIVPGTRWGIPHQQRNERCGRGGVVRRFRSATPSMAPAEPAGVWPALLQRRSRRDATTAAEDADEESERARPMAPAGPVSFTKARCSDLGFDDLGFSVARGAQEFSDAEQAHSATSPGRSAAALTKRRADRPDLPDRGQQADGGHATLIADPVPRTIRNRPMTMRATKAPDIDKDLPSRGPERQADDGHGAADERTAAMPGPPGTACWSSSRRRWSPPGSCPARSGTEVMVPRTSL
jgi:hypothetical protein